MTDGVSLPLPLLLGLLTLLGTLAGSLIAAFSKKWRTPADDREDKKFGIEADEKLLKRFEEMLGIRDNEIKELRDQLTKLSGKVEEVIGENRALLDWIYVAVRVVRDIGGATAIALLPIPPKGVFIADHPSNLSTTKDPT